MNQRHRTQGLVLIFFVVICAAVFTLLLHIVRRHEPRLEVHLRRRRPRRRSARARGDGTRGGGERRTVSGISNRGDSAVIGIALNKRYSPVYRDGTVRVATKTLVGENYIDLNPGDKVAGAVSEQGTLPISQAQDSVQLDQILSTFTPAPHRSSIPRGPTATRAPGTADSPQPLTTTYPDLKPDTGG